MCGAQAVCLENFLWANLCSLERVVRSPLNVIIDVSGIDQLVEIIKVLGAPTKDQIKTMNPDCTDHKFPNIKPSPWNRVGNDVTTFLISSGYSRSWHSP